MFPDRSPRIRHRNELTERDWENAVQGLGKVRGRYKVHLAGQRTLFQPSGHDCSDHFVSFVTVRYILSPVDGLKPFKEMLLFVLQDVCTVVPHWVRYKELIGILEASLQDIVDRWADGKVLFNSDFFRLQVLELSALLH